MILVMAAELCGIPASNHGLKTLGGVELATLSTLGVNGSVSGWFPPYVSPSMSWQLVQSEPTRSCRASIVRPS